MGLLDALFDPQTYSGAGGLLSRIAPSLQQFPQSGGFGPENPIAVGGYQVPRLGDAAQFQPDPAALPVNAQPVQGQLPPPMPQESPGGLGAGVNGFINNLHTGPLGALIGGIGSAAGMQSPEVQRANQTARFLVSKGLDPAAAQAIVSDPVTLRAVLPQILGIGGQAKSPTALGDGYIWNPTTKKVERAYTPDTKSSKMEDEIAAREAALRGRGIDPKDPKQQQFVLTGRYPREDAQPLSAADKKAIMSAEDDNAVLAGTIDTLNRAKELNTKTFTGVTAGARGWVGTSVPGAGIVLDEEASKATREFGQLMSGEAIKSMAETLKGATTDREMARFLEMLADPSTPPEIRERTINRMLQLAERQRKINDSRINDLRGGTYFKPGQGTSAPAAPANDLKKKYGLD